MKNLIGYNWKESSNGAIIEVTNPATGELIDTVPNVSLEDVDEAVKVAKIEQKKIPSEKSAGKMRQTDKNCTFAV